jgi:hypothetical protein
VPRDPQFNDSSAEASIKVQVTASFIFSANEVNALHFAEKNKQESNASMTKRSTVNFIVSLPILQQLNQLFRHPCRCSQQSNLELMILPFNHVHALRPCVYPLPYSCVARKCIRLELTAVTCWARAREPLLNTSCRSTQCSRHQCEAVFGFG